MLDLRNRKRFCWKPSDYKKIWKNRTKPLQKSELLAEYKLTFPNDKEFDNFEISYDALTELRKSEYELMYRDKPASVVKFEQAFFGNTFIEKLYRDFVKL